MFQMTIRHHSLAHHVRVFLKKALRPKETVLISRCAILHRFKMSKHQLLTLVSQQYLPKSNPKQK